MYCPVCSTKLCLCDSCKRIDNALNENTDSELFICKGCKISRPAVWWDALELDIYSGLEWAASTKTVDEIPEELAGAHEAPWSD